jgi:uncharacterized membrane protein
MTYLAVKYIHIVSAVFLLGFGMGSYLYFISANRTKSPLIISSIGRMVIWFDAWITTTSGVVQLGTGLALSYLTGQPLTSGWLLYSVSLFLIVGSVWLPVLYLQKRIQKLAHDDIGQTVISPDLHRKLYRLWFWMGVAGFAGMFLVLLAMVTKMTLFQLAAFLS